MLPAWGDSSCSSPSTAGSQTRSQRAPVWAISSPELSRRRWPPLPFVMPIGSHLRLGFGTCSRPQPTSGVTRSEDSPKARSSSCFGRVLKLAFEGLRNGLSLSRIWPSVSRLTQPDYRPNFGGHFLDPSFSRRFLWLQAAPRERRQRCYANACGGISRGLSAPTGRITMTTWMPPLHRRIRAARDPRRRKQFLRSIPNTPVSCCVHLGPARNTLQMTGPSLALWLNCPLNNWRLMEVFARLFGHQDKGPTPNGR
jgi:hypothetical protein